MRKIIRKFVRRFVGAREFETIDDALIRRKLKFLKKINKRHFDINDFETTLISMGLKEGDCLIVHSSWRSFIGFDGKPEDIINSIKNIIGMSGTLIMPCYGINSNKFYYDEPSKAGIISEKFRQQQGTLRSLNSTFSMCAFGKYAKELLNDHIDSKYCFDEKSPYFKAIKLNSKILLLGLGKKPHKITLFHCVTYNLKKRLSCYRNVYTLKKNVVIYDKAGNVIQRTVVDRQKKNQNNKKRFRKLFLKANRFLKYAKLNRLDIYLFEAEPVYNFSKNYIIRKKYNLYK